MQSSSNYGVKRKHDQVGQLINQITGAIDYLKVKREPQTAAQILGYLSVHQADDELKNQLIYHLKQRTQVTFDPKGLNGVGSFAYKPKIPNVNNADRLTAYLASRPTSIGVKYEDLRDGWPDCQQTIDDMEKKRLILVIRDRKGAIKLMWHDEPSLNHLVLDDLQHAWHNFKIPTGTSDELRTRLMNAGLKPTSAPRSTVKTAQKKDNKKRGPKRGSKQTNAHIAHLLKDYNHKR